MGRSKSFLEFSHKIDELQTQIRGVTYQGVQEASLFTKRAVMVNLGSTGAPIVMRQVGRKSRRDSDGHVIAGTSNRGKHKVGVRYNVKKTTNNYTSLVFAFGSMHWLEAGTQGHFIPKTMYQRSLLKKGRSADLRKWGTGNTQRITLKMTRGDGGFVRGPIWHPGSAGTRPWSRGIALAARHTPTIFENGVQKAVRKVF